MGFLTKSLFNLVHMGGWEGGWGMVGEGLGKGWGGVGEGLGRG